MKRIIVSAAVMALMISNVVTAKAGEVVHVTKTTVPKTTVVRNPVVRKEVVAKAAPGPVVVKEYFRTNAVRFAGGYYYAGRNHPHWTITKFSPIYKTTIYYDPGLTTWFYWNAGVARYYPVSYRP
jgi:hypothetical protein